MKSIYNIDSGMVREDGPIFARIDPKDLITLDDTPEEIDYNKDEEVKTASPITKFGNSPKEITKKPVQQARKGGCMCLAKDPN